MGVFDRRCRPPKRSSRPRGVGRVSRSGRRLTPYATSPRRLGRDVCVLRPQHRRCRRPRTRRRPPLDTIEQVAHFDQGSHVWHKAGEQPALSMRTEVLDPAVMSRAKRSTPGMQAHQVPGGPGVHGQPPRRLADPLTTSLRHGHRHRGTSCGPFLPAPLRSTCVDCRSKNRSQSSTQRGGLLDMENINWGGHEED